jgi:hypothetical protein
MGYLKNISINRVRKQKNFNKNNKEKSNMITIFGYNKFTIDLCNMMVLNNTIPCIVTIDKALAKKNNVNDYIDIRTDKPKNTNIFVPLKQNLHIDMPTLKQMRISFGLFINWKGLTNKQNMPFESYELLFGTDKGSKDIKIDSIKDIEELDKSINRIYVTIKRHSDVNSSNHWRYDGETIKSYYIDINHDDSKTIYNKILFVTKYMIYEHLDIKINLSMFRNLIITDDWKKDGNVVIENNNRRVVVNILKEFRTDAYPECSELTLLDVSKNGIVLSQDNMKMFVSDYEALVNPPKVYEKPITPPQPQPYVVSSNDDIREKIKPRTKKNMKSEEPSNYVAIKEEEKLAVIKEEKITKKTKNKRVRTKSNRIRTKSTRIRTKSDRRQGICFIDPESIKMNGSSIKLDFISEKYNNIELTVALPAYRSKDIAWLALESLCNQVDVDFEWELIFVEEPLDCFGYENIENYKERLEKVGCTKIVYKMIDKWVPLFVKWKMINNMMSKTSKTFVLQATDCYAQPYRLRTTYDKINIEDYDYISTQKTYIYDIPTEFIVMYDTSEKDPPKIGGSNMAVKSEFINNIPSSNIKRGVDGYIIRKILEYCTKNKKRFNNTHDKSDNWMYGLGTNGFNNISFQRHLNMKGSEIFKNIKDVSIYDILPDYVAERLISMKDLSRREFIR